jgi:hypothetical protein
VPVAPAFVGDELADRPTLSAGSPTLVTFDGVF